MRRASAALARSASPRPPSTQEKDTEGSAVAARRYRLGRGREADRIRLTRESALEADCRLEGKGGGQGGETRGCRRHVRKGER